MACVDEGREDKAGVGLGLCAEDECERDARCEGRKQGRWKPKPAGSSRAEAKPIQATRHTITIVSLLTTTSNQSTHHTAPPYFLRSPGTSSHQNLYTLSDTLSSSTHRNSTQHSPAKVNNTGTVQSRDRTSWRSNRP
jgi:hypothetical protein